MDRPSVSHLVLECYDSLTRGERRLADLLLSNPDSLVLKSALQLSGEAAVSQATTARFFKRLGFPSFKAAQKLAKSHEGKRPEERPHIASADRSMVRSHLAEHLSNDVQNLVRSTEALRSDEVEQAVMALSRAEKIWVVGFGDNYPLAHFTRALLIRIKADIRMIPIGGFSIPEEFASIQASDAMIALGIGRRTRSLRSIMRSAVHAGAQVVYVTDQANRSGLDIAQVTLRCRTKGLSVYESVVAPVSLVTYLCSAIALRIGQSAIQRLEFIESIHAEWGDMIPGDL